MLDSPGHRPLRARLLGHADLAEAAGLLPPWLPLAPELRAALPALWTRLLGQPGFNADVIEDMSRPPGQRLMALGMAVALDEAWARRLRDDPPPLAAAELYRALHERRFMPPDDRALAAMNAAGEVSFLVLHYHQRLGDFSDPDALQLLGVAMGQFRAAHAGYRLRALYQEGQGPEGDFLHSMGFACRTARPAVAGGPTPQLYGLLREQAATQMPGTPVRDAFQFSPPRLGLSASERRLLRLAVTDLPDAAVADELGLTGHTVKKLWRSVFQRVADRLPQLFDAIETPGAAEGTRGPEKRRHLLHYLRQHPEELRPWATPARASAAPAQPAPRRCGEIVADLAA